MWRVFYTNDDAGDNAGADLVLQRNHCSGQHSCDMSGTVGGNSSVVLTFDYDGNVQRGAASAGTTPLSLSWLSAWLLASTCPLQELSLALPPTLFPSCHPERNYSNP